MLKKPVPLDNKIEINNFDSGNQNLDTWFIKNAKQAGGSGSAKTYVVFDDDSPVAFYSLTVGQVEQSEVSKRIAHGMGNYPIPVIILAKMAVSKNYQGKQVGRGLLQDAIKRSLMVANEVGVRAIITHPIVDKAESFYKHFGFEESPLRANQLVLLLKDAKRVLS
ncbi:GNAT family N-acetyltransferase [Legionella sp. W05-934-2]|jgi:GNAT superfamily N-acetyltransferase|uniref:GNAT family N-acetyltransferase n=1 Tax=Legionella sp. W05-934-2 TaxID=1198649 RepID=UPI0034618B76